MVRVLFILLGNIEVNIKFGMIYLLKIYFWNLCAYLSVILAFMNVLPIPGLDGGHIFFLLWETLTGRKLSDRFMIGAQIVGMTLLILLLFYANGMDLIRWLVG